MGLKFHSRLRDSRVFAFEGSDSYLRAAGQTTTSYTSSDTIRQFGSAARIHSDGGRGLRRIR